MSSAGEIKAKIEVGQSKIRHRAEGRYGVTSGVEGFVHTCSSTRFQIKLSALGVSTRFQVEPPGGALGFSWGSIYRGGTEIRTVCRSGAPPPPGATENPSKFH